METTGNVSLLILGEGFTGISYIIKTVSILEYMRKWAVLDIGGECINSTIFPEGNLTIVIKTLSAYYLIY